MDGVKRVPKNLILMKNYPSLIQSTLKLFNALPVKTAKKTKPTKKLIEATINHGFIFSPQVFANFSQKELLNIIDTISDEVGLSPEQMNSSFHKSWKKVSDAPYHQLIAEQAFHYMTTYGYERMGVYDENLIYIPNEQFDVPELEGDVKLSFIKGYTKRQLKQKLLKILDSGIALKSIDEIIDVAKYTELSDDEVLAINNKEVRIRLYQHLDLIPHDPLEFLRLAVFEVTGKTLLIINRDMIEAIKTSDVNTGDLFSQYDANFGYKRLAEIFLRFKPLFLAFKQSGVRASTINRISHLSLRFHKPLEQPLMNNVTGMLKNYEPINLTKLKKELTESNIFRKIRLLQALHYRTTGSSSMLYKIRNGKGYVKEADFGNIRGANTMYNLVEKYIINDLKHLKGKKFYIPENIKYALPATEKQFTGNIPSGSYVTVPTDMIFGINWNNVDHHRIDLDLKVISLEHGSVGWDSSYRTENILFSGDVVDAHRGASELFYINKHYEDTMLLYVNYFNYEENVKVPFKTFVAQEHPNSFGMNYTVNPNNIHCLANTDIDQKQKILALIKVTKGQCRFYFSETGLGKAISAGDGEQTRIARDYLSSYFTNMVTLNEILEHAGAILVNESGKNVIDLSPENIEKDTFISLLHNNI